MDSDRENLHIVVNYVAAEKPYNNEESRGETVGQLKSKVLNAFGLTDEGPAGGGTTIVYTLYYEKKPLENLSETLGAIAGQKEGLEMNLSKKVVQGSSNWFKASRKST